MAADLQNALTRQGLYELLRQRLVREVQVASPAAGAVFSTVVPAGVVWELLGVGFRLVTSAVVANRLLGLRFLTPDGRVVGGGIAAASVAASNTVDFAFAPNPGYGAVGTATVALSAFTATPLIAGSTVAAAANGLDVGDQLSAISLLVRDWSAQQVAVQAKWVCRQLPTTVAVDLGGE